MVILWRDIKLSTFYEARLLDLNEFKCIDLKSYRIKFS